MLSALTRNLPALDPIWYQTMGCVRFDTEGVSRMLDSTRFCEALPYFTNDQVCESLTFVRDVQNVNAIRAMGYNPTPSQIARGILACPALVSCSRCPGFGRNTDNAVSPMVERFYRVLGNQPLTEELVEAIRLRGLFWRILGNERDFKLCTKHLSPILRHECENVVLGGSPLGLLGMLKLPKHRYERVPVDILALLLFCYKINPEMLYFQLALLSYEDRDLLIRGAAIDAPSVIGHLAASF